MATYTNASGMVVTKEAYYALQAARMRKSIGFYAAARFFQKNTGLVSLRLFILASQLQTATQAGF